MARDGKSSNSCVAASVVAHDVAPSAGEAAYGWTYVQLVSDAVFLNVVLHESDMFGAGGGPYVSCTYCDLPHGIPQHFSDCGVSAAYVGKMESAFTSTGTQIISLEIGRLALVGKLSPPASTGVLASLDILPSDDDAVASGTWELLSVCGRFVGTLIVDGCAQDVDLYVYIDRQSGGSPLGEVLDEWSWLACTGAGCAVVAFTVKGRSGSAVDFRWMLNKGEVVWGISHSYDPRLARWLAASYELPDILDLGDLGGIPIRLRFGKGVPLRKRLNEPQHNCTLNYIRSACEDITLGIYGACEFMHIGKHEHL